MSSFDDPELELLGDDGPEDESTGSAHAFRTAPIFTGDALQSMGTAVLPQRALYGRVLAQKVANFPTHPSNRKLYINTNAPFSALVCGVQGSGKSHSTSVLLESCLIKDARLGTLPEPLSAIVFHFDTAAGGGCVQPCEAAYLSSLDKARGKDARPPQVTVLVLPSNLHPMKKVYAGLPNVRVEPLHFAPEDISGDRLLAMMRVEEGSQMPLYMEAIMSILRSMEGSFDYAEFRKALDQQQFNPSQKAMLNLRLSLLDSCLKGGDLTNRVSTHFKKGHLTIIDLSSSFMDGSSACGFFDLILGLFVEADVKAAGKVVVLDEAHKYLSDTQSGTSSRLTDSLLSVIRQQRHLATRAIISTQEPTVVPSKFLDLCSFIIAHRFSSPTWLKLLANHVSAAESSFDELFNKIVSLRTGQAILFAASGIGLRESEDTNPWHSEADSGRGSSEDPGSDAVAPIGQGYLHVQSRLRVTTDGGHSILAVNDPEHTTRFGRVPRHAEAAETPACGAGSSSGWGDVGREPSHAGPGGTSASAEQAAGAAAPPCSRPANEKTWEPSLETRGKAGESVKLQLKNKATFAVALRPAPVVPPTPQPATSPSAYKASPALKPEKAQSASPVFVLTGALHRFRPLIAYLQEKLTSAPFGPMSVKTTRKYFNDQAYDAYRGTFNDVLDEALQLGLIQDAPSTGNPKIQLIPGAKYRLEGTQKATPPKIQPSSAAQASKVKPSTSTPSPSAASGSTSSSSTGKEGTAKSPATQKMHLAGKAARFVPLVQYLLEQKKAGFTEITVTTIRKRFGAAIEATVNDAVERNIVRRVSGAKPKICLVPTMVTW